MRKTELQTYRNELLKLKARTRSDATALAQQTLSPSGGQATGELSNAPMHLGDSGTEEFLHDLNATLVQNEEYLANEVRDALRRIEEGTYGRCESCGRPIAKERLDAIPFARLCISCAHTDDRAPDMNLDVGRPRRDDTLAPEGEMDEDQLLEETSGAEPPPGTTLRKKTRAEDSHAAGTPGGGTAVGGLAGSNIGAGDPRIATLQEAAGSGDFDATEERIETGAAGRPVIPFQEKEIPPRKGPKNRAKKPSGKPAKKGNRARK